MEKAIIGGTGVYSVSDRVEEIEVETEYGKVTLDVVDIEGEKIIFLPRHGKNHSVPPHLINYRANIMALKTLGVKYIYGTLAVGSCNESFAPGDVVIIKDFLDFTNNRVATFYEGGNKGVVHVDMSEPYCNNLIKQFYIKARERGIEIKGEGTYVCTDGPRFETAAEIKFYKSIGGDVVGMTNVPEVVLAKELGMCYSAIGIITNWCTGFKKDEILIHDITNSMERNKEGITKAIIDVFLSDLTKDSCKCSNAQIKM